MARKTKQEVEKPLQVRKSQRLQTSKTATIKQEKKAELEKKIPKKPIDLQKERKDDPEPMKEEGDEKRKALSQMHVPRTSKTKKDDLCPAVMLKNSSPGLEVPRKSNDPKNESPKDQTLKRKFCKTAHLEENEPLSTLENPFLSSTGSKELDKVSEEIATVAEINPEDEDVNSPPKKKILQDKSLKKHLKPKTTSSDIRPFRKRNIFSPQKKKQTSTMLDYLLPNIRLPRIEKETDLRNISRLNISSQNGSFSSEKSTMHNSPQSSPRKVLGQIQESHCKDFSTVFNTFDILDKPKHQENACTSLLFDDLEPTHFNEPPRYSYGRKHKMNDSGFSESKKKDKTDDKNKDKQQPAVHKKQRKSKKEKDNEKRVDEWVDSINKHFLDVEEHDVFVE